MIELYNFLLKIMNLANEYSEPDMYYVNLKYKLDSVKKFNKLYLNNLNQSKLLLFNSVEAEKLFIRLVNLDENYIERKYNKDIKFIITDFIKNKNNNYYFSICDEFFYINKSTINNDNIFIHQIKSHVKNCNCKIKVKSIVNLSINTLIKIIKNSISNKKNSFINLKKKIINSKNNLDLLDCIKILNTIKTNMGIDSIHNNCNNYTIDENLSENFNNLNIFINNNQPISHNKLKNYQFDTEFPINDILQIDSLIQQKLKDFSYSVISITDNQSKESNKSSNSSKSSSITKESDKSKELKESSSIKSEEHNKEDLLFNFEKIIEYFTNIDVNNFGECISGFELIYNLKKIYKNNNLIIKSLDIILGKVYKNHLFDKEELIKNFNDLCKIITK